MSGRLVAMAAPATSKNVSPSVFLIMADIFPGEPGRTWRAGAELPALPGPIAGGRAALAGTTAVVRRQPCAAPGLKRRGCRM